MPGAYPPPPRVAGPGPSLRPPPPPDYLVWSILVIFCCCLIPGIVGLVYNGKAKEAYALGDYNGAERYSSTTKTWLIVGAVLGALGVIAALAFGFISALMDAAAR